MFIKGEIRVSFVSDKMEIKIAIFLIMICGYEAAPQQDVLQQWEQFQIEFEKNYESPIEQRRRLEIFKENLKSIAAHNARYREGLETYEQGVTSFSDWTSEEFMMFVNRDKVEYVPAEAISLATVAGPAPQSIDWRDHGAVMEVKQQGRCGSCWAFAATGALEAQLAIHKGIRVSLSEQNLVDCANATYFCNGCKNGTKVGAFEYIHDNGVTLGALYPYTGKEGTCQKPNKNLYKIRRIENSQPTEAGLQKLVGKKGPTTATIEATNKLQNYKSGIFFDNTCKHAVNHAILVVGYGSVKSDDYWIIKNSWGPKWGESGFFRLARNRGNNCDIANFTAIPIV